MTTLTFDTHDFVKKLKGAGFSEEQAEVLTDLQKNKADLIRWVVGVGLLQITIIAALILRLTGKA
jgi:hypothetical protein